MPKQGKTPKKKSKEKTPQKSGESEYPAMDEEQYNRLFQNAIEHAQAQLEQKHADQIKPWRLEADSEAKIKVVEERLTRKFDDEVRELNRAFEESRWKTKCAVAQVQQYLRSTAWPNGIMADRALHPIQHFNLSW